MITFRLAASAGRVSAPLNRGLGAFCFSRPKPETQSPPPRLSLLRRSRQPFQGSGDCVLRGRGRLLGPGARGREPRVGGRPPLHLQGRVMAAGQECFALQDLCTLRSTRRPSSPRRCQRAPGLRLPGGPPTPTCRAWQRATVGAAGAAGVIWRGHGAWLCFWGISETSFCCNHCPVDPHTSQISDLLLKLECTGLPATLQCL